MRLRSRLVFIPIAILIGPLVPAAAMNRASTPSPQTITGIVQTIIREHPHRERTDGHGTTGEDTTKVLRVGTNIVPLVDGSLPRTKDGSTVSVTVLPSADGSKRVLSANTVAGPVAATVPSAHHLYVVVVVPAGLAADASITDTAVNAMVSRVSQYWSSQTGGQVRFDVAQIRRDAPPRACPNTLGMWADGLARMPLASAVGSHLVVVAPNGADSKGCDYGLGTVGGVAASGNKVFVSGLDQSLLAHELGHNLGLHHSNSLRCGSVQDKPAVSAAFPGCQANPYDDLFDVMGYSGSTYGEGNLNAVHLDGMNLLPRAVRKIPASSGVTTAVISPLSHLLTGTTTNRTLKVTDPSGARYFVEYRTNSGRDAVAGRNYWHPAWGVRVLRDDPANAPSAGSYELDATPSSAKREYNRSIPIGGTFTSASRRLTIKVVAQDANGARVTISSWAAPVVPATLTRSMPSRAWVGTAVTAATRVTDLHGLPVAGWTVTLQKQQRGTTSWRVVKTLRTTPAGTASYRFANGVSGRYRWVTSPVTGAPSRLSPTLTLTSTARVGQRRPATSMTRGKYLSVHGSVSSVPAPFVSIQYRYPGGAWRTGPRAKVTGTAVSGRIAFRARTAVYTRLRVKSATSYVGSTSPTYRTVIR